MAVALHEPTDTVQLIPLGELCRIVGGGTPSKKEPQYYQGTIPWITVKDFTEFLIVDTVDHINDQAVSSSATNVIPDGTVLVVTRVGLGKVAMTTGAMAINQDIKALFPDDRLVPEYLFWFLLSKADEIERMGTGATVKGITLPQLKSLSVPVPQKHEQHRIVNILKRADSIRCLRKQAQGKASELILALFIDMFGDPISNPNDWIVKPLSDVANIGSGVTKGRKLDGHQTIKLPYLAVSNVQDGHLNLTKVKSIRIKPKEQEKYQVLPGDLLMTEGGDPDKLGRGAIWNGEIDVCLHQNHIFKVRCNRDVILPEYLRSIVGSHYGKGYFLRIAKQTTGIASINKTQLSKFPILVPPISLQNDFVEEVVKAQSILNRQEAAVASADASYKSLLYRAFRRTF